MESFMIKENLVFGNINRCKNKYWEIKDITNKPSDKCNWNIETNRPVCFNDKGLLICPYAVIGELNDSENIDSLSEYENKQHKLYFCTAQIKKDYNFV
jgi:hypothetical protein